MPELPEVETTRQGIAPHVCGQRVSDIIVREPRLRWPVPTALKTLMQGQVVEQVGRRGKYLLLETPAGVLMVHLGMSGSLRIINDVMSDDERRPKKHDHVDILFGDATLLRFHDPRRFGSIHWLEDDPLAHPLLASLGPEPLGPAFSAEYLYARSRGRSAPIKAFIMDSRHVVGVGNIYANEALFMAGIDPRRHAGKVSRERMTRLVDAIRFILARAIQVGGTTLRDFVGGDGKPGYFSQSLAVYGRAGQACTSCGEALNEIRMSQRSTVFCRHCQR